MAWLEAAGGDHLLSVSHLDEEGVQVAPQDSIGVIVEWHQGRHVAVPVHQHMGGVQERLGKCSCRDLVESVLNLLFTVSVILRVAISAACNNLITVRFIFDH